MKKGRGVFGGTAGLWLVRKRHRAARESGGSVTAAALPATTTKNDNTQENGEDDAAAAAADTTINTKSTTKVSSNCSSSDCIQWDEERCRPVYSGEDDHSTASTHPSSSAFNSEEDNEEADDDENEDDNNKTPMFASIKKSIPRIPKTEDSTAEKGLIQLRDTKQQQQQADPPPPAQQQQQQGQGPLPPAAAARRRSKKGAVFGGRNKRTFVPVTEHRDSLSSMDDTNYLLSDEENPQQTKRICVSSSQNESAVDADADEVHLGGSVKQEAINNNHGQSLKDGIKRSSVTFAAATGQETLEASSIFDFDKNDNSKATANATIDASKRINSRKQPGHRTSLDVARAFFAQIDADPSLLTLVDERLSKTPTPARRPVRTTRGKLPRRVAQAEYHTYCRACRDAQVEPLPVGQFLEQRSEFFRPGEVFDGMFDD